MNETRGPARVNGSSRRRSVRSQRVLDDFFCWWSRRVTQHAWAALLASAALIAACSWWLPEIHFDSETENFLTPGDPAGVVYDEFREHFGQDKMILIALETDDVFELGFLSQLVDLHHALEAEVPHVDEITSLANARLTRGDQDELIVEDLAVTWPKEASELGPFRELVLENPLYIGTLLSADASLAIVTLSPSIYRDDESAAGFADFDDAEAGDDEAAFVTPEDEREINAAVHEIVGRFASDDVRIHVAGSPVVTAELTRQLQDDLSLFIPLSYLANILLLWLIFRRVSGVLIPLGISACVIASTVGLMALFGIPISLPLGVLPTLLMTVVVCQVVHVLAIFYKLLDGGASRTEAVALALEHAGSSIVLTSLTTALGLLSFALADIAAIVQLGWIAPLGLLIALILTLALVPALLAILPIPALEPDRNGGFRRMLAGFLESCHRISTTRPGWVAGVALLLAIASGVGASRVHFSFRALEWFPDGHPVIDSTALLDAKLGGTTSLEVVIDTGAENGLHDPALLRRIDEVMDYGEALSVDGVEIGKALSVTDLLKEIHRALNGNESEHYRIADDRPLIAQELLLFESSGSDDLEEFLDSRHEIGRISMRLPSVDGTLYTPYLREFEAGVLRILGDAVSFRVTGLSYLASHTITALVESLTRSYAMALTVITPIMIFAVGSYRRGLLCMVPNLLPVLMTLGLMGFVGLGLNPATIMAGGIIIGLAVDDTLHFMRSFNRYYAEPGTSVEVAIQRTLRTTGSALLFTSLALSGGFFVLSLSAVKTGAQLGLLAGFGAGVAFFADVLLTPALLVLALRGCPRRGTEVAGGRALSPVPPLEAASEEPARQGDAARRASG